MTEEIRKQLEEIDQDFEQQPQQRRDKTLQEIISETINIKNFL